MFCSPCVFVFLHLCFFLLFLCNNSWRLGGGFVVYSFFIFTLFCLFWPFAFLLYFAFLAGCTNSWRRRVFIFVLFVFFTFLHLFTFFALYEFLYFLFCTLPVLYYFAFFVLIAGAREFFLYFYIFCIFVFVWTVHTNFHAKSAVCTAKNE